MKTTAKKAGKIVREFKTVDVVYRDSNKSVELDHGRKESAIAWPSLGTVSVETARKFAKDVLAACDLAEQFDREYSE